MTQAKPYWSPYVGGVAIGLTMLAAFVILGSGLGASGAFPRGVAAAIHAVSPAAAENHNYWKTFYDTPDANPLRDWMVFQVLGVFFGGLLGALTAGRFRTMVERGEGFGVRNRIVLAFVGGTMTGIAARLARGCTSGQALTGGAQLALGSWAFMLAVFAGGYLMAYFLRRQWA